MIPTIVEQLRTFRGLPKDDRNLANEERVLGWLYGRNARTGDIQEALGIPRSTLSRVLSNLQRDRRVTNWRVRRENWWSLTPSEVHRRRKNC